MSHAVTLEQIVAESYKPVPDNDGISPMTELSCAPFTVAVQKPFADIAGLSCSELHVQ